MDEADLVKEIRRHFEDDTPMPIALHDAAMQLYRQYLIVGGMPECVQQFAQTKDYLLVRHTQDTILLGYLDDMSKYNTTNEIKKTRLCYDNVTVQLSKKNTRFQYKLIKKGARASEFENAIEWLGLSGIVSQVYRAEQINEQMVYASIANNRLHLTIRKFLSLMCIRYLIFLIFNGFLFHIRPIPKPQILFFQRCQAAAVQFQQHFQAEHMP